MYVAMFNVGPPLPHTQIVAHRKLDRDAPCVLEHMDKAEYKTPINHKKTCLVVWTSKNLQAL